MVLELLKLSKYEVIYLSDYKISHFDYTHKNKNDDFLPLIKKLTSDFETLVFATPVYWYSMSGIMKVFFDRITDLLTIEKELGRKLKDKNIAVITSSNGNNLAAKFWLPFEMTAEYLGMNYITNLHTIAGKIKLERLVEFNKKISEI